MQLLDGLAEPLDAVAVADRLLAALADPYELGEHRVYSTAGIGIVTSDIAAESAEQVLRDADTAMYEAKLAGKARYVLFDLSMRQRVQDRMDLENALRTALEAGELFLMYQPIVSLITGKIESFEALLRWKHLSDPRSAGAGFAHLHSQCCQWMLPGQVIHARSCLNGNIRDNNPRSRALPQSRKCFPLPRIWQERMTQIRSCDGAWDS